MPRSGTTWAYDILTSHPEVAGIYESRLFVRDDEWDRPQRSGLGQLETRAEIIADLRALTSDWLARALQPQHRFLVEKSSVHGMEMDFIAEVFPEGRFIHVLRDGRDVVVSIRAAALSWAPIWQDTFGSSVFAAAESWHATVRTIRASGTKLGPRYLEIRFEDLKDDALNSCKRLFGFSEIDCNDGMVSAFIARNDFSRFPGGENRQRRGGRVGDWRHRLDRSDRAAFATVAGDLLVELEYERNRTWIERP
jgi:hypothetical protein